MDLTGRTTRQGFGQNFRDDNWEPPDLAETGGATGRWPANVALRHVDGCRQALYGSEFRGWVCAPGCPVAELDRQSGESRSTGGSGAASGLIDNDSIYGAFSGENKGASAGGLGDTGGASRYFATFPWKYQAKASRAERNAGLEGFEDFDFIGIEREAEYVEIARARIDYWARQPRQLGLLDAA